MALNIFILKYILISNTFIDDSILSTLDHINYFLDRLFEKIHECPLEFCTKKGQRLSLYNTDIIKPVFNELKDFIMIKAEAVMAIGQLGSDFTLWTDLTGEKSVYSRIE